MTLSWPALGALATRTFTASGPLIPMSACTRLAFNFALHTCTITSVVSRLCRTWKVSFLSSPTPSTRVRPALFAFDDDYSFAILRSHVTALDAAVAAAYGFSSDDLLAQLLTLIDRRAGASPSRASQAARTGEHQADDQSNRTASAASSRRQRTADERSAAMAWPGRLRRLRGRAMAPAPTFVVNRARGRPASLHRAIGREP
jgi:hypothetical protein